MDFTEEKDTVWLFPKIVFKMTELRLKLKPVLFALFNPDSLTIVTNRGAATVTPALNNLDWLLWQVPVASALLLTLLAGHRLTALGAMQGRKLCGMHCQSSTYL